MVHALYLVKFKFLQHCLDTADHLKIHHQACDRSVNSFKTIKTNFDDIWFEAKI